MAKTGIGEELRRERLRQGFTLDDIVLRTRISPRSLEAIEADEFDRLPGTLFARNFVRLYATDLKLDADALVARLPRVDIEAQPLPNPPSRSGRTKWDPRLAAALASVLWLVTAAGAGTGAWYYFNQFHHSSTKVAAAPAPSARPGTATLATKLKPLHQANPKPAPVGGIDNTRPVQVILTATEAAWVRVSADGQTEFVGMLHPHDTRAIAADAQVNIVTGNAGGLEISLNGKPLDPIGPSGQVRTVRLTAEGPQFVPRNPPVSSPL